MTIAHLGFCVFLLMVSVQSEAYESAAKEGIPREGIERRQRDKAALKPHIHFLNEFTERRQTVVFFPNPQSIFQGVQADFVHVGKGNLSFQRRDLVTVSQFPVVVSRIYDSHANSNGDFGTGGWSLSAAEYIHEVDSNEIEHRDEFGSLSTLKLRNREFEHFPPRPTDVLSFRRPKPGRYVVDYKSGIRKIYRNVGQRLALTKVLDRHGNTLELTYSGSKLRKLASSFDNWIEFERDTAGRITTVRDDLGRTVGYSYDGKGRLQLSVDLAGNAWKYEYDESDRLISAINPDGSMDVAAFYDANGRVNATVLRGLSTSYDYISPTETKVVRPNGRTTLFRQELSGITTEILGSTGVVSTIQLDEENRALALSRNDDVQAEWNYDSAGRISKLMLNPLQSDSSVIRYEYNPDGQIAKLWRHGSRPSAVAEYDESGNIVYLENSENIFRYAYDRRGSLTKLERADGTSLTLTSDPRGTISSVGELGQISRLEWSPAGRLLRVTFPNGEYHAYSFNEAGLRSTTDVSGQSSVSYWYNQSGVLQEMSEAIAGAMVRQRTFESDEFGRVVAMRDSDGNDYKYEYDEAGQFVKASSRGFRQHYDYDKLNRLIRVRSSGDTPLTYRYRPGEPDLRHQQDKKTWLSPGLRIDSGYTFTGLYDGIWNRAVLKPYDVVVADLGVEEFQIPHPDGVVFPNQSIEAVITKLRLVALAKFDAESKMHFAQPSNLLFVPPEYWSTNCGNCPPPPCQSPCSDPQGDSRQEGATSLASTNQSSDESGSLLACPPPPDTSYEVTVLNTMIIPLNHVRLPEGYPGDPFYGGDNNETYVSGRSYRIQQTVRINPFTGEVLSARQSGLTKEYLPANGHLSSSIGCTRKNCNCPTYGLGQTGRSIVYEGFCVVGTPDDQGTAINMGTINATRTAGTTTSITVELVGAPKNSLLRFTPAIDWNHQIVIRWDNNNPRFSLKPQHDGFPLHDLRVNGRIVYVYDPILNDQTPNSLFGSANDVNPPWINGDL